MKTIIDNLMLHILVIKKHIHQAQSINDSSFFLVNIYIKIDE